VLCIAFLCLQVGFVIFRQKEIGAKAKCKMLVKLTEVVNFINILRAAFSYKNLLHSFSLLQIGLVIFRQKEIGAKAASKMLVKSTKGWAEGPIRHDGATEALLLVHRSSTAGSGQPCFRRTNG